MKLYKFLMVLCIAMSQVAFISCNDANRQVEIEDELEMETETIDTIEEDKIVINNNTIGQLAKDNPELSTWVSAMETAGLADMLMEEEGPFTVFAPKNTAFESVPYADLEDLMRTEDQSTLRGVLQYYVVPEKITAAQIKQLIEANGNFYTFETVGGGELTANIGEDEKIILTDDAGNTASIVQSDIIGSNGVIHLIDELVFQ